MNGKRYVGQTVRDIQVRFHEHCFDTRSNSKIHKAIVKYGWQNFTCEVIEEVDPSQLDEREKFYIKAWQLQNDDFGYNIAEGGTCNRVYQRLQVVENGLIFPTIEAAGRMIAELTSWWTESTAIKKLREIEGTNKTLCDYHFKKIDCLTEPSPIDVLEDWIKGLTVRYAGKHVYCEELNKEFATIAEAAKYILENGFYQTTSKTPVQSVVTAIGKNINGKTECLNGVQSSLHFTKMPGRTKQDNSPTNFQSCKVHCPQINQTFDSQKAAAQYFLDKGIWSGITLKTARLRISDVVRGYFPDYRGYTFEKV